VRTLTHEQARGFYDRLGSRQDSQAWYEDVATSDLVAHTELGAAGAVLEFGCGTGRFAEKLLEAQLAPDARYLGVDASPRMVELARGRLERFGERAAVRLTDGDPRLEDADASFDRYLSNYVFDLLSEADMEAAVGDAARLLRPGGLLGLVSLSWGSGLLSGSLARVWSALHRVSPVLVGGCRPIELGGLIGDSRWKLRHRAQVQPFGIPSEIVVAERTQRERA
jgi:ubiquinone/menaquinone biosynthesis C-methylase UbiE